MKNKNPDKKIKILVTEDEKLISKAYLDGLTNAGFTVAQAFDGKQALAMLKKNIPDLLLLDLLMPEKSGFEVMEEIKKDKDLKKIPVIIMSNIGQEADIKKGEELGADDYLLKSNHDMKNVVNRINVVLKKRGII